MLQNYTWASLCPVEGPPPKGSRVYGFSVVWLVFLETMFVTFIGAVIGMFFSFLLVLYFHYHPIEFTGQLKEVYQEFGMDAILSISVQPSIFYYQALTVFLMGLAVSVYPSLKILRLNPLEAMRS